MRSPGASDPVDPGLGGLAGQLRAGLKAARPEPAPPSRPPQAPGTAAAAGRSSASAPALAAADRLLRAARHPAGQPAGPAVGSPAGPAVAVAPRRWLLVDQAGRPHRLVGPSSAITIGRVAAATGPSVAVVDASVSRRHAVVTQVDDRLHVSDAGSTNGTWLQRGTELLALDGQGAFAEAGDLIVTVNGLVLAQVALESPEVRT